MTEQNRPETLRDRLDLIPRQIGETGDAEAVPVVRQGGQVFADELAAAEAHHGRKLMTDERELPSHSSAANSG